jgi:hypothetical protein
MNIIELTIRSSKKPKVYIVVEHIEFLLRDEDERGGTNVLLKSHNNGGLHVAEPVDQVLALMLDGPYYKVPK